MRSARTYKPKKFGKSRQTWKPKTDAKKVRSRNRWKKLSELYRSENPVCEDPFDVHWDRIVQSEEVHHIKPIATFADLAFDWDNLIALCRPCHERAEKEGIPER